MRIIKAAGILMAAAACFAFVPQPAHAIAPPAVKTASVSHIQWNSRAGRTGQSNWFHRHHRRHHRRLR